VRNYHAYTVSRDGVVKYVGITARGIEKRWVEHKRQKACKLLSRAIEKHGADAFEVTHVASSWDMQNLLGLEIQLIEQFGTLSPLGYNLKGGGRQRVVLADSVRLRISETSKGRIHSDASKEKNRIASTGRRHTAESKAKVSAARIGMKFSASHRAAMSLACGKPHTPETRAKMSATRTGRKQTPEWVAKRTSALIATRAAKRNTSSQLVMSLTVGSNLTATHERRT
jgi:group I intron endonuclease